ncbi:MAPEG family protein [Paraglaciecola chathamensis]|uniref:Transmembrane protein n=1 Tax=Paraglaciecola agarilytica NO2 TaxID=1125747 RepID=A0ABQ0I630_9ALTE|nr:MAPEG family protein [Paraglaciecola agarilytica]GAC04514.1 transmembrane protein [Paraglaciecola agarilytica NO2]
MTIILICLLIAALLPIVAKVPLTQAMNKEQGGYDNRYPREQQKQLSGFGARASAAHANCFEALILFVPGALAVIATQSAGHLAEYSAIVFITARIGYLCAYWCNVHLLRSILWAIGYIASLFLIWLAIP